MFPRTPYTGSPGFPRMENIGSSVSGNAVCRKLSCRELRLSEARFPRRVLLGSLVHKGLGGRRPTQVWGCLGPQVLQLLQRALATEDLVAVRVATEARYHVAGCLGLRNLKLGPRPAVGRHFGRFFFGVEDAALLEGEVLRVTQGKPEEKTLRWPQLAVHAQLDAFDG